MVDSNHFFAQMAYERYFSPTTNNVPRRKHDHRGYCPRHPRVRVQEQGRFGKLVPQPCPQCLDEWQKWIDHGRPGGRSPYDVGMARAQLSERSEQQQQPKQEQEPPTKAATTATVVVHQQQEPHKTFGITTKNDDNDVTEESSDDSTVPIANAVLVVGHANRDDDDLDDHNLFDDANLDDDDLDDDDPPRHVLDTQVRPFDIRFPSWWWRCCFPQKKPTNNNNNNNNNNNKNTVFVVPVQDPATKLHKNDNDDDNSDEETSRGQLVGSNKTVEAIPSMVQIPALVRDILRDLRTSRHDPDVVAALLEHVTVVAEDDSDFCHDIGVGGGIPLILKIMKTHENNATVQRHACGALCNTCFGSEHNLQTMVVDDNNNNNNTGGGIQLVLKAMKRHLQDFVVLEYACRLLVALTYQNPANRHAMVAKGVIALLIQAMQQHEHDNDVQQYACATLKQLSLENELCIKIVKAGGIETILQAMTNHLYNPHIQREACQILGNLAWNNNTHQDRIIELSGIQPVFAAMKQHPIDSEVQYFANFVLMSLCVSGNSRCRQTIIAQHGIPILLHSMQRNAVHAHVQSSACRALAFLFSGETIHREDFPNGVQTILQAMKDHFADAQVQAAACEALGLYPSVGDDLIGTGAAAAAATTCLPENQNEIFGAGGLKQILHVMECYRHDASVQAPACLALVNMIAYNKKLQREASHRNGLLRVLDALQRHALDTDVQIFGCFALAYFVWKYPANQHVILASGLQVVLAAMQNHLAEERVQIACCLALHWLGGTRKSRLEIAKYKPRVVALVKTAKQIHKTANRLQVEANATLRMLD